jgi:hypothetical protein
VEMRLDGGLFGTIDSKGLRHRSIDRKVLSFFKEC